MNPPDKAKIQKALDLYNQAYKSNINFDTFSKDLGDEKKAMDIYGDLSDAYEMDSKTFEAFYTNLGYKEPVKPVTQTQTSPTPTQDKAKVNPITPFFGSISTPFNQVSKKPQEQPKTVFAETKSLQTETPTDLGDVGEVYNPQNKDLSAIKVDSQPIISTAGKIRLNEQGAEKLAKFDAGSKSFDPIEIYKEFNPNDADFSYIESKKNMGANTDKEEYALLNKALNFQSDLIKTRRFRHKEQVKNGEPTSENIEDINQSEVGNINTATIALQKFPKLAEEIAQKQQAQIEADLKYQALDPFSQTLHLVGAYTNKTLAKAFTDLVSLPRTVKTAMGATNYGVTDWVADNSQNLSNYLTENFLPLPSNQSQGLVTDQVTHEKDGQKYRITFKNGNITEVRDEKGYQITNPETIQGVARDYSASDKKTKPQTTINSDVLFGQGFGAVADMASLLFSAGKFTKGFEALKYAEKTSQFAGLTTAGMIMTHNQAYNEAISSGMNRQEAGTYATSLSLFLGMLENVSPNRIAFGENTLKVLTKDYQKLLLKGIPTSQALALSTKKFFKELGEENIQEISQNAAENFSRTIANGLTNANLNVSTGDANQALETVLLTTLATTPLALLGANPRMVRSQIQRDALYTASLNADTFIPQVQQLVETNQINPEYGTQLIETVGKLNEKIKALPNEFPDGQKAAIIDLVADKMYYEKQLLNPNLEDVFRKKYEKAISEINEDIAKIADLEIESGQSVSIEASYVPNEKLIEKAQKNLPAETISFQEEEVLTPDEPNGQTMETTPEIAGETTSPETVQARRDIASPEGSVISAVETQGENQSIPSESIAGGVQGAITPTENDRVEVGNEPQLNQKGNAVPQLYSQRERSIESPDNFSNVEITGKRRKLKVSNQNGQITVIDEKNNDITESTKVLHPKYLSEAQKLVKKQLQAEKDAENNKGDNIPKPKEAVEIRKKNLIAPKLTKVLPEELQNPQERARYVLEGVSEIDTEKLSEIEKQNLANNLKQSYQELENLAEENTKAKVIAQAIQESGGLNKKSFDKRGVGIVEEVNKRGTTTYIKFFGGKAKIDQVSQLASEILGDTYNEKVTDEDIYNFIADQVQGRKANEIPEIQELANAYEELTGEKIQVSSSSKQKVEKPETIIEQIPDESFQQLLAENPKLLQALESITDSKGNLLPEADIFSWVGALDKQGINLNDTFEQFFDSIEMNPEIAKQILNTIQNETATKNKTSKDTNTVRNNNEADTQNTNKGEEVKDAKFLTETELLQEAISLVDRVEEAVNIPTLAEMMQKVGKENLEAVAINKNAKILSEAEIKEEAKVRIAKLKEKGEQLPGSGQLNNVFQVIGEVVYRLAKKGIQATAQITNYLLKKGLSKDQVAKINRMIDALNDLRRKLFTRNRNLPDTKTRERVNKLGYDIQAETLTAAFNNEELKKAVKDAFKKQGKTTEAQRNTFAQAQRTRKMNEEKARVAKELAEQFNLTKEQQAKDQELKKQAKKLKAELNQTALKKSTKEKLEETDAYIEIKENKQEAEKELKRISPRIVKLQEKEKNLIGASKLFVNKYKPEKMPFRDFILGLKKPVSDAHTPTFTRLNQVREEIRQAKEQEKDTASFIRDLKREQDKMGKPTLQGIAKPIQEQLKAIKDKYTNLTQKVREGQRKYNQTKEKLNVIESVLATEKLNLEDANKIYNAPHNVKLQALALIEEYMNTPSEEAKKAILDMLPPTVANVVSKMRNAIDILQQKNIEQAGIENATKEQQLQESIGSYQNRSYQVHDDKDYKDKVSQDKIDRAKEHIIATSAQNLPKVQKQLRRKQRELGFWQAIQADKYNENQFSDAPLEIRIGGERTKVFVSYQNGQTTITDQDGKELKTANPEKYLASAKKFLQSKLDRVEDLSTRAIEIKANQLERQIAKLESASKYLSDIVAQNEQGKANVEGWIGKILSPTNDLPTKVVKGGKLGSKDLAILKSRKDIPLVIRELMGEYHDPLITYTKTVLKLANLVHKHDLLTDIRTMGLQAGWLKENPTGKYTTPIAPEGSEGMKPLNGLYTTPEIAEAFKTYNEAPQVKTANIYFQRIWDTYTWANNLAKKAQTVWSLSGQFVNFSGNMILLAGNGHQVILNLATKQGRETLAKTFEGILAEYTKKGKESTQDFLKTLYKLGVINQDVTMGDLREMMKSVRKSEATNLPQFFEEQSKFWKVLKGIDANLSATYGNVDNFFKIYTFLAERKRYAKAMKKWTPEQLDQRAANITLATLPSYDKLLPIVQQLRYAPLLGSFVAYVAEVPRITYNSFAVAFQEINTPETRKLGIYRLTSLLAMQAGIGALPLILNAMRGVDDEEDKANRRFSADYNRFNNYLYHEDIQNGKATFTDLGRINPYGYLYQGAYAFWKSDTLTDSISNTTGSIIKPFLGTNFVMERLLDSSYNQKSQGGQAIYNQEDDGLNKFIATAMYVGKLFTPATATQFYNLYAGLAGMEDDYGKTKSFSSELSAFFGLRVYKRDNVYNFRQYKMPGYAARLVNAEKLYNKEYNKPNLSLDAKDEALKNAERAKKVIFEQMHQDVMALAKMGVSVEELEDIIRDKTRRYLNREEEDAILYGASSYKMPSKHRESEDYSEVEE
ncbi:MAG: hypothetical protein ACRC78_21640 [Planktothrix sp.]